MFKLFSLIFFHVCINICFVSSLATDNNKQEILACDIAKSITVKLLAEKNLSGSGVIINESKGKYTILTNLHLLNGKQKKYKIQTIDGKQHLASIFLEKRNSSARIRRNSKKKTQALDNLETRKGSDDLALLQFSSKNKYSVAQIFPKDAYIGSRSIVFAAGFPAKNKLDISVNNSDFSCDKKGGEISFILDRPMRDGYQIGYFITIAKGMSGGALVNSKGELVGINGRHNYPLFPDYIYKDGKPVEHPLDLLNKSSWAIPITTIESFISENSKTIKLNRSPSLINPTQPTTPPPVDPTITPPPPSTITPPPKSTITPPPPSTITPPPKSTITPPPKSTITPPPR
jgi:hypothetical protein